MKRTFLALIASAALTAGVIAAAAPAGNAPDVETVGGFALKVAAAFGADATDQTTAVTSLKALGVSFEQDVSARLTEKQAARILADLGLEVVPPANPNKAVSVAMANLIATRVALTSARGTSPQATGMPTQCLSSKSKSACVDCCKMATLCGTSAGTFACNVCAKFCMANVPPPPSPGSP